MKSKTRAQLIIIVAFVIGVIIGLFGHAGGTAQYELIEDNALETIISIKKGDDLTLLNVNRYEDGGGLWEVTYDGKSEPVVRRVE